MNKTGNSELAAACHKNLMRVPRFINGQWQWISDPVTREEPFTVSWSDDSGGESPVSAGSTLLWAWPHEPEMLALGHVLLDCAPSSQSLHREAQVEQKDESSYHVRIGKKLPGVPPVPPAAWDAEALFGAMHAFISAGGHWDDTGCFHRAGIFDPVAGELLFRAEDIGRHNCVDRLAGWSVLRQVPLSDKVLLVSARLTSSLCGKALRAGFRILVSRSAVTSAAIHMSREAGATLAGFARTTERRFTLFTDTAHRLGRPEISGIPAPDEND